jgi:hypothetical protein
MLQHVTAQSRVTPQVYRFHGGGYDRAGAIAIDAAGNFYIAGSADAAKGQPTFAALRFDGQGNLIWRANYSGSAGGLRGHGLAIAVDAQGNVYTCGYVGVDTSSTETDVLVVKFDTNGIEQWAKRYNGSANGPDAATEILIDAAGNIYVSGYSYGSGFDWITFKYSPSGSLLWTRRHSGAPGNFDDGISAAGFDPLENLVLTGFTKNRGDSVTNDITTLKYDSAGNVVWLRNYTETDISHEQALSLAIDAAGAIYISGDLTPTANPEGPLPVPLTLTYDSGGNLLRAIKEASPGTGMAIALDQGGNLHMATQSHLYTYDSTGTLVRSIPHIGNFLVADVVVDSQSNVLVAGSVFEPGAADRDYYTTKFSPAGQQLWAHRFNGTGDRHDVVEGAALDHAGNLYVTGTSWSNYISLRGTADDIVTLKFSGQSNLTPTPPAAPAAPGSLVARAVSKGQITLSWTDHSGNEAGFRIERCTGAGCLNFTQIAQVGAGVTSFSNKGLQRGTTYSYRVSAFNAVGDSGYSNTASATTPR